MCLLKRLAVFTSLGLFALSGTASAGEYRGYKIVECPKIPPAYSQLINNLASFKSQIKSSANCEGVKASVSELENLVASERRTKFLSIIRTNADKTVTPEDADFLRKYAEETTNYSLRVMTILQGKQDCFQDEGESGGGLNTLTSVVYEATSLLSKVAGPYGVPIAIGGNLLTGVLKGIQAMNENRQGYRFEKSKDRQAFTEQLCIYHSYRREIDDVLRPQVRIAEMKRLMAYLTERLAELKANCDECARLAEALPESLERDTRLVGDAEELRKAADSAYAEKLGTKTVEIAISRNWAAREIERLEELRDLKLRSIGPQEVMFLKNDLDRFFFHLQAPEFLRWQTTEATTAGYRFEFQMEPWLGKFLALIEKRTRERAPRTRLDERFGFAVMRRSVLSADELAHFESETMRSRDQLLLATSAWKAIVEYCDFFSSSRALTPKILGFCAPDVMKSQAARIPNLATYDNMMNPELWRRPLAGEETLDLDPGRRPPPSGDGPVGSGGPPNIPGMGAPSPAPSVPPPAETWTDALEQQQREWRMDKRKFQKK